LRVSLMGVEERLSAQKACQIGLVSEVVPHKELHARAQKIAAVIASKPSVSTQGTVRAIWESLDTGRTQAMSRGLHYTQLGNDKGIAEVENMLQSGKRKDFEVR